MNPKKVCYLSLGMGVLWDIILVMILPLIVPFYPVLTIITLIYYFILFLYFYSKNYFIGQVLAFLFIAVHIVYFIYLFSFMFAL